MQSTDHGGKLHISGQINIGGGGFCSIRSRIEGGLPADTVAIRVSYVEDGKTYKSDLPTKVGVDDTAIIRLDSLIPSLQGGPTKSDSKIDATKVEELGFKLSLKLSSGESNPIETFGSGVFPFSLKIRSIDAVSADEINHNHCNN
ncbi:hypothetical protein ACHAXA_008917 [Cyclostephanos tholiformis]|uniref:Uncharacterized protein n=1 Tax=Cyclostephanos tholiformis TaxID=382380 RepID=A0ABD3R2K3_9STRA